MASAGHHSSAGNGSTVVLRVEEGQIEGEIHRNLMVFKGIPFAQPPVDALRWCPPEPAIPWNGIKQTKEFGPSCPQAWHKSRNFYFSNMKVMSEDCLYLNVWAPVQKKEEKKRPVLVWIHGGGFTSGTTSSPLYDGGNLARKGVVFVSIAYRTGPFGFLAHPLLSKQSEDGTSGTYGLLDQIAALKWIKKNIEVFGGDPSEVTVMGESAGAISIGILVLSPLARGLFVRAISQSGGALQPPRSWRSFLANDAALSMPLLSVAEEQGRYFLNEIRTRTLAQAYALEAEELVRAAGPDMAKFWPPLDGKILPGEPYALYEAGLYNDIPVLCGTNSDEGALFMPHTGVELFRFGVEKQFGIFSQKLLTVFAANSDSASLRAARDLVGDSLFRWPTWTWGRLQARTGGSPVYPYLFCRKTEDTTLPGPVGALHATEIAFAFGNPQVGWTDEDYELSELMSNYWINFVRTGDPNGGELAKWEAGDEHGLRLMKFDRKKSGMIKEPCLERLKMLDRYFAWRRSELVRPCHSCIEENDVWNEKTGG